MATYCDFHMHTSFSDGRGTPEELVDAALKNNPEVKHLALTDHNGFYGCERFIAACEGRGVEGFVSAELDCRHDLLFRHAFHFLPVFGNRWDERTRSRAEAITPIINAHHHYSVDLTFGLMTALDRLGYRINFDEVREQQGIPHADGEKPTWQGRRARTTWEALGMVMERRGIPSGVEEAFKESGVEPDHYAPLSDFYDLLREIKPALILAHPMKPLGEITPDDLRPVLEEWVEEDIGFVALEYHYEGTFYPEWKALADEFGLLGSAGSDTHRLYQRENSDVQSPKDDEVDVEALVAVLRKAGDR